MNLILGMIVRDEQEMLLKTLPIMANARAEKRIAVDTGSSDHTVDLLESNGFKVLQTEWHSDYAEARNTLFMASHVTPGWVLMLDADECMYNRDIELLRERCETSTKDLITLPRYNLADHGNMWEFGSYPDKQARVLRLGVPLEFRKPVHEAVHYRGHDQNVTGEGMDEFAEDIHIYHYGLCKTPANNWLRSHRYVQIQNGEPEIKEVPPEIAAVTEAQFLVNLRQTHTVCGFMLDHPLKCLI